MIRLTLRSGRDGRFLARVLQRNGHAFVLDMGDARLVEDAAYRLRHGFTTLRDGELVVTQPDDPAILRHIAAHYLADGMLALYEECEVTAGEAPGA